MESTKFIENLKKQYIDAADIGLTMNSEFRQIGSYDSLTGMTIIVMIKDEYNVDITDSEYRAQRTIKELYNLILSKLPS
jgi:acyl carrier protein